MTPEEILKFFLTEPPTKTHIVPRERAIERYMQKYYQQKAHEVAAANGQSFLSIAPGYDPVSAGHVCKTPFAQLKEVSDLRNLKTCQINPGFILWCTVIRPVHRLSGVWALVEDEAKNVVEAGLYNIAPASATFADLEDKIFPVGTRIGFKDPYIKAFRDGSAGIRVDHKSNVEIRLPWEPKFLPSTVSSVKSSTAPVVQTACSPPPDPAALLAAADGALKAGDLSAAEAAFTKALKASPAPARLTALAGRAKARLGLGKFSLALADVEAWLASSSPSSTPSQSPLGTIPPTRPSMLLLRAECLRGLRRYSAAVKELKSFKPSPAEVTVYDRLKAECETLHLKYGQGRLRQDEVHEELLDDFYGSIELRLSPGKGRGLFTTRPVKKGEMLILERPFARGVVDKENPQLPTLNLSGKVVYKPEHEAMIEQVLSRITASKVDAARFSLLYGGDNAVMSKVPEKSGMDFFRFDDGEALTMGAEAAAETPSMARIREVLVYNTFGNEDSTELYLVSSFINHNKTPNTERMASSKTGNLLVVAKDDLPAGVELTTSYGKGEGLMKTWGIAE